MDERERPPEAPLTQTEYGLHPTGPGWYVMNATEALWWETPGFARTSVLEPRDHMFEDVGVNIRVLDPGHPNCRYHAESNQEDFLVLSGECILIIEGEERRLRQWDFVHCPPWTRHVFVGTGDEPCALLLIGVRNPDEELDYPVDDEAAVRHGAAAPHATTSPDEAYADLEPGGPTTYRAGDLPEA